MKRREILFENQFLVPVLMLVLFLCFTVYAAPTGKIAGRVVDQATGDPLPGVNVVIEGTTLGAATDIDGIYFILLVPPGSHSVQATMIGYKTLTKTQVRVNIDKTTELNFELEATSIEGEEVTVVAKRPVVELNLSASKQYVDAEEIAESWTTTIQDVMVVQSGVNVHGGVRGGFGLDVEYNIDGQSIRDRGSNQTFAPISTTAIQEMEILTGGFNAEYGQANSGIINVVTKAPGSQYHGSIKVRYRPSGVYHWGGNIYGQDRWEYQMFDDMGNPAPGNPDFWDPTKGGNDGGGSPYTEMTPAERVQAWQEIISGDKVLTEYADRSQMEYEGTLTGPVPLIKNLGFMLSGKYKKGVLEFPSALEYQPEWNVLGKLNYNLGTNTKLVVMGMHSGVKTSGNYVLAYGGTSEDGFSGGTGNPGAYFTSAWNVGKYWPYGSYGYGGGTGLGRVKPPQYVRTYSGNLKLTHIFSPSTFIDVMYEHQQTHGATSFFGVAKTFYSDGSQAAYPLAGYAMNNGAFQNWGEPGDRLYFENHHREHAFRADLTSQLSSSNQVKFGTRFSTQYWEWWNYNSHTNDQTNGIARMIDLNGNLTGPANFAKPWEASAYLQDKIEVVGMVINAGLRLEMFNANIKVSPNAWDPLGASPNTPGGAPSDERKGYIYMNPDNPQAVKSPTQVALAPRIGISHPITESTVLHFMYGHFIQRPTWLKIISPGQVQVIDPDQQYSTRPDWKFDANQLRAAPVDGYSTFNNAWLNYERTVQYEVGFDQNLLDRIRFDFTLYYKDAKALTSTGLQTGGRDDANSQGTSAGPSVTWLRRTDTNTSYIRDVKVVINGGTLESRGLEVEASTMFMRNLNLRLIYNMAYAKTDRYGPSNWYYVFPDGSQLGNDSWHGGNNGDGGTSGNSNERWNPNHVLKLNVLANTPKDFGPAAGSFYPLGNWTLNVFTTWNSGQLYTWHAPGDFSTEVNNKRWEGRMFTNLRLAKGINLMGTRAELSLDVINLFNQHQLAQLGGSDLDNYELNGELPKYGSTGEPLEWQWYYLRLLPRKVVFGLGLEF